MAYDGLKTPGGLGTSNFQLLELHVGDLNDTDRQMAVGDDMWPSRRFYMNQVRHVDPNQTLHFDQRHQKETEKIIINSSMRKGHEIV